MTVKNESAQRLVGFCTQLFVFEKKVAFCTQVFVFENINLAGL